MAKDDREVVAHDVDGFKSRPVRRRNDVAGGGAPPPPPAATVVVVTTLSLSISSLVCISR